MGLDQEEIDRRVRAAARFAGLDEGLLEKSPFDLSGGQKRRVAIAGVIAMEPEVLILDEPSAGLDPAGRRSLLKNIKEYHRERGTTVVMVSHSMDEVAENVDRSSSWPTPGWSCPGTPREVFSRAGELVAVGLDVPQVTRVAMALRQRGVDIDSAVYTVADLRRALNAVRGGNVLKCSRTSPWASFFPGNSLAHKLDPRTKLILTVVYIVGLFCAESFLSYGLMAALLIAGVRVSGVAPKALVRGLKPVLFIICFTAVLNLFYNPREELVSFWIFTITKEGVLTAFFMVLRITMLIMGTFLLTYTTSPISLTDGMESLLNPLKKIRVPVHELAMMMSIALRFIPTLIEETDKIMSAQKARGADFESGSIIDRAKALVPILVPLFISAFRRPTSWRWPWSAAVITAATEGPSSTCFTTRPGTTWCCRSMPSFWRR